MRRGLLFLAAAAAVVAAAPAHAHAHAGEPRVTVVATLHAPSLARATASSRALSPRARRGPLSVATPTSAAYLRGLGALHRSLEAGLAATLPEATVLRRYRIVVNGLAISIPRSQVARLGSLAGVAQVYPNLRYRSTLDRSVPLIGAPTLWGPDLALAGSGIKIAVLDDGIDPQHPFFAGTGFTPPAGFPKGPAGFTNAKIIVARAFPPRSPAWKHAAKPFDPEFSTHGTHVAGIAAGNFGVVAETRTVSGVAPRAFLGNYKVLTIPTASGVGLDGNSTEIVAGIEAAVADGMDVINLSIGEPEVEPSRDLVVAALNAAAEAGVVPVAASGNDFPEFGRGSVGSPGTAAKAITVAAATKARAIADFSSSGPTPLSLQLKPELTAPGASILSSVPASEGLWASFSGTSMAAPHVSGASALLQQQHPEWTPAQIKSALALTGDLLGGVPTLRQGGGLVNLVRANAPLVHAAPVNVSFGFVRRGQVAERFVDLADAGGGAGRWAVTVEQSSPPGSAILGAPSFVDVPGRLTVIFNAPTLAAEGDLAGWLVLTRGAEQRRIAFWGRIDVPSLGAPSGALTRTGTYRGDTRGRPSSVGVYAFPEGAQGARLDGPEQVFRFVLDRPVANFGVAVTSTASAVEPRIVLAGSEDRLTGFAALPLNLNPYLRSFQSRQPVSGAELPAPGSYDIVFDSRDAQSAGAFTFRFWIDDVAPPKVRLLTRTVKKGKPVQLQLTDAGSGIEPGTLTVTVDGGTATRTFNPATGRLALSTRPVRKGKHTLVVEVSDYQETKNNENQPRILPNTVRYRATFTVR